MSEPRAFWCPCCPYKLLGLLTVPFKQRCPKCRRTIIAEQKNGLGTLTIRVIEPKVKSTE